MARESRWPFTAGSVIPRTSWRAGSRGIERQQSQLRFASGGQLRAGSSSSAATAQRDRGKRKECGKRRGSQRKGLTREGLGGSTESSDEAPQEGTHGPAEVESCGFVQEVDLRRAPAPEAPASKRRWEAYSSQSRPGSSQKPDGRADGKAVHFKLYQVQPIYSVVFSSKAIIFPIQQTRKCIFPYYWHSSNDTRSQYYRNIYG